MEKVHRRYGTSRVDYQLHAVLKSNHEKYNDLENEIERLEQQDDPKNIPLFFKLRYEQIQHGVISIITAIAHLEAVIFEYGTHFITPKSYLEHLDKLKLVSKWIVIPEICQKTEIKEDRPEINDLKELIKARNAIIHQKIQWIDPEKPSVVNNNTEIDRFHRAASKSLQTTDNLIKILKIKKK
ncbi:MAG: hypothetical protein V2I50_06920 [Desulfuromusa sp.]|jgi:hypothetical protein|nr:hypothetical protein [Desulfuromusa sp.]